MPAPRFSRSAAVFLLAAALLCNQCVTTEAGCLIRINGGLPNPQPLILKQGGSHDVFGLHLPSPSAGAIDLYLGELVRLVCPGPNNRFKALTTNQSDILVRCIDNTWFTYYGDPFEFNKLACVQEPAHIAKKVGKCNGDNDFFTIGFEIKNEYFKFIDVCFDSVNLNPVWSKYDLVANIKVSQTGVNRPSWTDDDLYLGLKPDNLYKKQSETITKILGSSELADRYTKENTLSRGHLTAKADFVYGSGQRATFHFINAAPQWESFNGGNWNMLEQSVRNFAGNIQADLKVYTGTHGISTLPDINNVSKQLFLNIDQNNNGQIPVPALFWKVVYNPKTTKGVAIVGVNNPYVEYENLGPEYFICQDVCDKVKWLQWKANNKTLGYGYCCDVKEFRKNVTSLPDFPISGLLVGGSTQLYGIPTSCYLLVLLAQLVLK